MTVHPHPDAAELANTMITRGLRSVPVLEQDRLAGTITRRDLVRTISRNNALIAAHIRRRLEGYGAPDRWTVHVQPGTVTNTDQYDNPAKQHVALVPA